MPFGQTGFGFTAPIGAGGALINTVGGFLGGLAGGLFQPGGVFGPDLPVPVPTQPPPQTRAPFQLPSGLPGTVSPSGPIDQLLSLIGAGGADAPPGASCPALYSTGGAVQRVRPNPLAMVPRPDGSGKIDFWGPRGRPILFSGDLAACKRVERAARKSSRAVGRTSRK